MVLFNKAHQTVTFKKRVLSHHIHYIFIAKTHANITEADFSPDEMWS